jgi:hypothetical protein
VVADALRVLVWLAGERTVPPHTVEAGPSGTVTFAWQQGDDGFEVRLLSPGRIRWRASSGKGPNRAGRQLDRDAADLLRSLIPLARSGRSPRPPGRPGRLL